MEGSAITPNDQGVVLAYSSPRMYRGSPASKFVSIEAGSARKEPSPIEDILMPINDEIKKTKPEIKMKN